MFVFDKIKGHLNSSESAKFVEAEKLIRKKYNAKKATKKATKNTEEKTAEDEKV